MRIRLVLLDGLADIEEPIYLRRYRIARSLTPPGSIDILLLLLSMAGVSDFDFDGFAQIGRATQETYTREGGAILVGGRAIQKLWSLVGQDHVHEVCILVSTIARMSLEERHTIVVDGAVLSLDTL